MNSNEFISLKLRVGDYIYILDENGESFNGCFDGEYNNSNNTFKLSNFSNGNIEIIEIDKLQQLRKI